MATNSASSNPIGVKTADDAADERNGAAPASDVQEAIAASAKAQQGVDGAGVLVEKTPRQLEKERKQAEKLARLAAKKEKLAAQQSAAAERNAAGLGRKKAKAADQAAEPYVEQTKPGEKKVLQDLELPALKSYNPLAVESAWYEWWNAKGFFEPEFGPDGAPKERGIYTCIAPPPNVTGALHIGHALTVAIQDTLARWHRMRGETVLYLGGFDHAGISTQSVVEKRLWAEKRETRHDYSREDFLKLVWEWKEEYHTKIKTQFKRIGASFDWSREAFTLDESRYRAVVEAFCRLHDEGVIYRADRLVNWCTALQTTLSNLEVDQRSVTGRTKIDVPGYTRPVEVGALTSFAYEIEGGGGERIVVATTRPETMLGDTAIAVHPDDERYKHLHGKYVTHPFVNRRIPIVTDAIAVDKEFGTGAVKITPAHDFNDYQTGVRHGVECINILNDDGTFNANAGEFAGYKRFDARRVVVDRLKELGLFVDVQDNAMTIPVCSKTGDIIEPLMKPQWWVRQQEMADAAAKAVETGAIKIEPDVYRRDFLRWMDNVHDWCISRQLWWGHRVPVYFVNIAGEDEQNSRRADGKFWVSAPSEAEARVKAEAAFPGKTFTLEQDEDVLDTWFSSGLWPFTTLGWPQEDSLDLARFFPTTLMETGWDILFFWVARMVMLSLKLTGQVPFKEVFCHALVRDAQGRKMSKSLGNVIDPLDVIEGITLQGLHDKLGLGNLPEKEIKKAKDGQRQSYPNGIPQCGTDALRFALCAYTSGGRDINLDVLRVEGYRKFCNKIYNATKFAMMRLGPDFKPSASDRPSGRESLVERWVLQKFNTAAAQANKYFEAKEFLHATNAIYSFWLYEFCDVYIEASKYLILEGTEEQKQNAQQTLYTILDGSLRLIHPLMPFVTEEMWQRLPRRPGSSVETIMKAEYPEERKDYAFPEAEAEFDHVFKVVQAARSLMTDAKVKQDAKFYIEGKSKFGPALVSHAAEIESLIKKCDRLTFVEAQPSDGEFVSGSVDGDLLYLRVPPAST